MAIEKYDVQALFATPYFKTNLKHAITEEHVKFVRGLKMIKNRDNLISENLYIFEEPEMAGIKAVIQEALDIYSSQVMGVEHKLYVTQSWALSNPPGIGMHSHSHSNSLISGSFYYDELPQPLSRVIFDKHTSYQQLEINPLRERQNLFNTPVNVLTPESNDLILFPSYLNHQIEANMAQTERRAIAFNCFIKGQLGNYRDVSELML